MRAKQLPADSQSSKGGCGGDNAVLPCIASLSGQWQPFPLPKPTNQGIDTSTYRINGYILEAADTYDQKERTFKRNDPMVKHKCRDEVCEIRKQGGEMNMIHNTERYLPAGWKPKRRWGIRMKKKKGLGNAHRTGNGCFLCPVDWTVGI